MRTVDDRDALGSWIDGAPSDPEHVPGSTWGLPESGPGSVVPISRRFGGYAIDWAVCALTSALATRGSMELLWPLFTVMSIVLLSLFGATIGQFVLGMRTVPVQGTWPMPLRAVVRTVLLLVLIPALIWNRDLQPLQDAAAGTAVVRA